MGREIICLCEVRFATGIWGFVVCWTHEIVVASDRRGWVPGDKGILGEKSGERCVVVVWQLATGKGRRLRRATSARSFCHEAEEAEEGVLGRILVCLETSSGRVGRKKEEEGLA